MTSGGRPPTARRAPRFVKDRSQFTIAEQSAEGKPRSAWAECDAARPATCRKCGAPSRPIGGKLQIVGHGVRDRLQRGPPAPAQSPIEDLVTTRRYRCKLCGAVIVVAPRGVIRRRLYAATAIGLSLALFGIDGHSAAAVREAIAPTCSHRDRAEGATWTTLRRWAREAKAGALIHDSGCPASFTLRQAAERVATSLMTLGRRGLSAHERVWEGANEAAWRGTS